MRNTVAVELTEEELAAVTMMREQKAKRAAEEAAKEEAKKSAETLEKRFREAVAAASMEIDAHLRKASEELVAAVKASEKYGVPFRSDIVDLDRERLYTPHTFKGKWSGVDEDVLEDFDMYPCSETGWEYWSTSSLSC